MSAAAFMHPMAPHPAWMTPTAAFMPAGPAMAYGAPHAAMYGQWHPHPHMPHMMAATAAPSGAQQSSQAAAGTSNSSAAGNSSAHPLPAAIAFHSSNNSGGGNNSGSAASATSPAGPLLASTPSKTQRPIPHYATASNLSSATAMAQHQPAPLAHSALATARGKKQKATATGAFSPAATVPAAVAVAGGVHQPQQQQSSVAGGSAGGVVSFAPFHLDESVTGSSSDVHTAEGRARLMADIRAMINDRKRNDVKRRYLAMKDKLTALDTLALHALRQQLDAAKQAEQQLADRKQQLLEALMHYEGKRWLDQSQQQQWQRAGPISSKTGRWVLCGKRKANGDVCSNPVKRAKKGQAQRLCRHHQSQSQSQSRSDVSVE